MIIIHKIFNTFKFYYILDLINFIIKNLNNRIIIKIINKKKYFQ